MTYRINDYIRYLEFRRDLIANHIVEGAGLLREYNKRQQARVAEIDRIINDLRAIDKRERRELWYMRKLVRFIIASNPPRTRRQRLLAYKRRLDEIREMMPA